MKNIINGKFFLMSEVKKRLYKPGTVSIETDFSTMDDIIWFNYTDDDGDSIKLCARKFNHEGYNEEVADLLAIRLNSYIEWQDLFIGSKYEQR